MEFGITFKGFVSPDRARNLVRQSEAAGFTYCWFTILTFFGVSRLSLWQCVWSTLKPCVLALV